MKNMDFNAFETLFTIMHYNVALFMHLKTLSVENNAL
jgi:hypothetical protein